MDEPELKIIDVFICKLRKKLANASEGRNFIETVWAAATCCASRTRSKTGSPPDIWSSTESLRALLQTGPAANGGFLFFGGTCLISALLGRFLLGCFLRCLLGRLLAGFLFFAVFFTFLDCFLAALSLDDLFVEDFFFAAAFFFAGFVLTGFLAGPAVGCAGATGVWRGGTVPDEAVPPPAAASQNRNSGAFSSGPRCNAPAICRRLPAACRRRPDAP